MVWLVWISKQLIRISRFTAKSYTYLITFSADLFILFYCCAKNILKITPLRLPVRSTKISSILRPQGAYLLTKLPNKGTYASLFCFQVPIWTNYPGQLFKSVYVINCVINSINVKSWSDEFNAQYTMFFLGRANCHVFRGKLLDLEICFNLNIHSFKKNLDDSQKQLS